MRDYNGAIADYDEVIRLLKPKGSYYYHKRGEAKFNLGQFTAAIQDFDEARPQFSTYKVRGLSKFYILKFADAIADFDEAIRLETHDAEVHYFRGYANFFLGQIADAIQDFEQAMELDTNDDS